MTRRADATGEVVHLADQPSGVWAGGTTRAIVAIPGDAPAAPARARIWIGTATITRAAPFSYFEGRTRIHMPIRGGGIRLRFQMPPEEVTLGLLEHHRFSGARPVQAELVDGPLEAFNLIVADGCLAATEALRIEQIGGVAPVAADLPGAPPEALIRVFYTVRGAVEVLVDGRAPVLLAADDALVIRHSAAPVELRCVEPPMIAVAAWALLAPGF